MKGKCKLCKGVGHKVLSGGIGWFAPMTSKICSQCGGTGRSSIRQGQQHKKK